MGFPHTSAIFVALSGRAVYSTGIPITDEWAELMSDVRQMGRYREQGTAFEFIT